MCFTLQCVPKYLLYIYKWRRCSVLFLFSYQNNNQKSINMTNALEMRIIMYLWWYIYSNFKASFSSVNFSQDSKCFVKFWPQKEVLCFTACHPHASHAFMPRGAQNVQLKPSHLPPEHSRLRSKQNGSQWKLPFFGCYHNSKISGLDVILYIFWKILLLLFFSNLSALVMLLLVFCTSQY